MLAPAPKPYPQIRPQPQLPKTPPPWRDMTIIWLARTSPLESTPAARNPDASIETQRETRRSGTGSTSDPVTRPSRSSHRPWSSEQAGVNSYQEPGGSRSEDRRGPGGGDCIWSGSGTIADFVDLIGGFVGRDRPTIVASGWPAGFLVIKSPPTRVGPARLESAACDDGSGRAEELLLVASPPRSLTTRPESTICGSGS